MQFINLEYIFFAQKDHSQTCVWKFENLDYLVHVGHQLFRNKEGVNNVGRLGACSLCLCSQYRLKGIHKRWGNHLPPLLKERGNLQSAKNLYWLLEVCFSLLEEWPWAILLERNITENPYWRWCGVIWKWNTRITEFISLFTPTHGAPRWR